MKKLMLGLVLVALVACIAQPADAARRLVIGDAMKWVKANGSGSTTYDSTRVSIVWSGIAAADMVTNSDTTLAFDMGKFDLPNVTTAADSTALVGFFLKSYESDGTTAAGTDDSTCVAIQFSVDGSAWTTMNAATGCWYKFGETSNNVTGAFARLNRTANANVGCRYVRALVANVGDSTSSSLVRYYECYPVYWQSVPD